MKKSLIIITTY